jgi:hypothetical protein
VQLELRDLLVQQALRDLQDLQDHKVPLVLQDREVERRDHKERLVQQVRLAQQVQQDHKERLVQQVLKAKLDQQVQQEQPVQLAQLVRQEFQKYL